jgi:hypothetical protein
MSTIAYKKFDRLLTRCDDMGTAADAKLSVALVYKECLSGPAAAFRDAHAAIPAALTASRKEKAKTSALLDIFDGVYREARAVALAFEPALELPETLKSQPTDTDRANAIEALAKVFTDHAGASWADALAKGDFGTLAPSVVEQLGKSAKADKLLADARATRSTAFNEAHTQFMAFKNVVRQAHGQTSLEYRRIHVRVISGADKTEEPPAPQDHADTSKELQADLPTAEPASLTTD